LSGVSAPEPPSLQERLTGAPPARHLTPRFYYPAALGALAAFVIAFPAAEWQTPFVWGWCAVLALGMVAGWRCWRLAENSFGRSVALALILAYLAAFLLVLIR
jgi:hypothetical protein